MSNETVHLAIYDLSHGMARQMSAQFLGPQFALEIIPHTALVVFGREYFFGGGIQHQPPQEFRQMTGMHPVQTLSLGTTAVSRIEFEQWCQRQQQSGGRYTAASYDLLERNCNNFSHDAALEGLRLPQGVPQWILEVPGKFLASPIGQMARPMLQNMQVTGGGSGGMAAPFANAPTSHFGAAVPAPPPPAAPVANPWANIPAETDLVSTAAPATPVLDSFCKPLLSSDSKTISLCIKKLVSSLDSSNQDRKECLESIGNVLSAGKSINSDQVEKSCASVLNLLQQTAPPTTFSLMFLRVVILYSTDQEPAAQSCLEWISTELMATAKDGVLGTSHAARAMAWLTLANAASLQWWKVPESILETALGDLSVVLQPRPEVRQAAAALCYNHVVTASSSATFGDELSDTIVSLLCSSLDSIALEPDATTRLRRVMVAARILQPVSVVNSSDSARSLNGPSKMLMQELGFADSLQELVSENPKTTGNTKDGETCRALAKEMVGLLQQ